MTTVKRLRAAIAIFSTMLGGGLMVLVAHSNTAGSPFPSQAQPREAAERAKTGPRLMLEVVDRSNRSPLPGATLWVLRYEGPPAHLGRQDRRRRTLRDRFAG